MSNVTEKILNTIKEKKIAPKPRWHFIIRQALIWLTTFLSMVVGSLTFSVIIFRMVNNDWEVLKFINRSPAVHVFNTLPYIWIVLLILFVGLAYYNTRHTKGAYKYSAYWFLIGSVVISMLVGSIFYALGIGPRVHMAVQHFPVMQQLMLDREAAWLEPENGLLAGEISQMLSGVGVFTLTDFEANEWVIVPAKDYMAPPHFIFTVGEQVRIIGKIDSDEEMQFIANRIFPYHMGPGQFKPEMRGNLKHNGSSNFRPFSR